MNTKRNLPTAAALAAALAASLTLAACQPGQDTRTASTPNPAEGAKELAEKAMNTASDAAITVAVNTALAKDEQLSVLRIDVNTVDGHVVLDGSAPDAAARQRATQLARGVDGVKSVDNRLTLPPTS
jgi:hyperosmotically inducible periplasmic protein